MKLEEYLERWAQGETSEVGLYLAMAKQAEREGYPEVASALQRIAWEEAEHAAEALLLAGKIGGTKENLEKMLAGEQNAAKVRLEEARHHGEPEKTYFYVTAKAEERHAEALRGLLKRYFGQA
jgi:rubrerythrin